MMLGRGVTQRIKGKLLHKDTFRCLTLSFSLSLRCMTTSPNESLLCSLSSCFSADGRKRQAGVRHLITVCLTRSALYLHSIKGSSLNQTRRRRKDFKNSRARRYSISSSRLWWTLPSAKQADKSIWAPPTARIRQSDGWLRTAPASLIYAWRRRPSWHGRRNITEPSSASATHANNPPTRSEAENNKRCQRKTFFVSPSILR